MNQDITGTRSVLSAAEEVREAVVRVAEMATRSLTIFTQDLEPQIYDSDPFLEVVKRLVLAKSFARVRVLVCDPARAVREGHRFVTMARRLNTFIEFRNVRQDLRGNAAAFLIADDRALVYRLQSTRWEGIADLNEPAVARKYLNFFDEIWHASEVEPELRQMYL